MAKIRLTIEVVYDADPQHYPDGCETPEEMAAFDATNGFDVFDCLLGGPYEPALKFEPVKE